MSTWDQEVSWLSGTEAVPGAILSQLLLPLAMKQHLSEQQENTSGREGGPTQRNCSNTGSGLYLSSISHSSQPEQSLLPLMPSP